MQKEQQYAIYFGKSIEYFLARLEDYKAGNKYTFNISAFLLGAVYFMYRKMYKEGVIFLALIYIEQMIEFNLETSFNLTFIYSTGFNVFMTIFLALISGFIFNRLYLKKTIGIVEEFDCTGSSEETIQQKGGTSMAGVIALVLLIIILTWLDSTYFLFS